MGKIRHHNTLKKKKEGVTIPIMEKLSVTIPRKRKKECDTIPSISRVGITIPTIGKTRHHNV